MPTRVNLCKTMAYLKRPEFIYVQTGKRSQIQQDQQIEMYIIDGLEEIYFNIFYT